MGVQMTSIFQLVQKLINYGLFAQQKLRGRKTYLLLAAIAVMAFTGTEIDVAQALGVSEGQLEAVLGAALVAALKAKWDRVNPV